MGLNINVTSESLMWRKGNQIALTPPDNINPNQQKSLLQLFALSEDTSHHQIHANKYIKQQKYGKILKLSSSPNTGKYGPRITPYLDTFHSVGVLASSENCSNAFTYIAIINFIRISSLISKLAPWTLQNKKVLFPGT